MNNDGGTDDGRCAQLENENRATINDGGLIGRDRGRIQFDFRLNGVRYRPNIKAIPTEPTCAARANT
jgi:hypothetical protein